MGVDELKNDVAGRCAAAVPSHLLGPLDWKPGLQEQKESVPFTTQWASSPSMHTVRLLRQSLCTLSARTESQGQSECCKRDDKAARRRDGGLQQWQCSTAQHTFLVAVDFIRAVILAVVEVVAAKDGADASAVGAEELVLLAHRLGRWHYSGKMMRRVCYLFLQVWLPGFDWQPII